MDHLSWKCLALIVIALCSMATAAPVPDENSIDELNPIAAEQNAVSDNDREKRKIFGPEVGLGVKNAILGYVFGEGDDMDGGRPVVRVTRATPVLPAGVTDDTPDFDREMVKLDIPDKLYSDGFQTITNISTIFGKLLLNTSRRYAHFVQYFKPLLGKALTIKGLYPPPPTTTERFKFEEDTTTESNNV